MRIVSGLQDAGWHDLRASGAYEWWYVDALSADGRTGFVFIFFAGLPFSPDYLTDHERRRGPSALDHVAVFAAVYRDGRQVCYALDRYDRATFSASRDRLDVAIGANTCRFDGSAFAVAVDLPLLLGGSRLTASLALSPRVPASAVDFGGGAGDAEHVWNPLAPSCAVSGEIALHGGRGWSESFDGEGYVDHNYGEKPLTEGIRRWHWGRAHLGDRTLVYYHTEPERGPDETVLALVGSDGTRVFERPAFSAADWKRRPLCPRFPTRVGIAAEARVTATVRSVLDWGPFYMRFLSDVRCEVDGGVLEAAGVTEYFDPRGLRARWLRPLIKTRIRRV